MDIIGSLDETQKVLKDFKKGDFKGIFNVFDYLEKLPDAIDKHIENMEEGEGKDGVKDFHKELKKEMGKIIKDASNSK